MTAVALMRSRYAAFVRSDADYLRRTWHESTRPAEVTPDPAIRWTRLRVLDVVAGGATDDTGVVEFRAHYRIGDEPHVLHERSTFERVRGAWTHVSGDTGSAGQR